MNKKWKYSLLKGFNPVILDAAVENANPNDWVIIFDRVVTSTSAGWTLKIGGVPATITGTSGSGTNTLTFTTTETVVNGNVLTLDYDRASGDCLANSLELGDLAGLSVTNNVT